MTDGPVDQAARSNAVHSRGSVLVQAPAGSGKTTLLAQRYLRLLAGVDRPERILALTFTRRAAQEMRDRVMLALHAAAAGRPDRMNQETWELGCAAMAHLRAQGLDLARQPSRLRIETIDAFNAWLAAQLPISAGSGSRLNLTDAPAALYEEAARRALAYSEPDQFGAAVERVLALDDQRWGRLVTLVAGMLPGRDRWLPLLAGRLRATALDDAQLRAVRRHLDEDLGLLVTRAVAGAAEVLGAERLAAVSRLLHAAAQRLDPLQPAMNCWRADPSCLRADLADLDRWRSLCGVLLTAERRFRRRFTRSEGFPPDCADKSAMADLIVEFDRDPAVLPALVEVAALPDPRYDDAQWQRVRDVAQVLVLGAAQLDQVFRDRGVVDFPALSMAAARALGSAAAPTDLNLRLDYRLQHILVDEFQDTSSAQLELVKLLTAGWQRGDGRSIFCVGDPMQSIYGFRQAEVRAFLELAEEGIGEVTFEVERLRSNFRSAAPLVAWINACFARILPGSDDRQRGAIAFRPSEAAAAGVAGVDAAVHLRAFAERADEAAGVAQVIEAQAARHPGWRMAILVRARTHAREIAAALRARSVAFRAVDIEPLAERPAVRDLVSLIRALLHRGDRRAWLAVLRAPWAGLTLADLLHLARSTPVLAEALSDESVLAGLSADGRVRCARVRVVFEAAWRTRAHVTLPRWVEQTWLALGGASVTGVRDLPDVGAVFERLAELERRGLPDAAQLGAAFDDLFAAQSAGAAVEIMTIHKAKGLEFDLVVVPALDRRIPQGREELLLSHQFARGGRDGMVMAARPGIGAEADALFDFLRRRTRDAGRLESQRLLYVACTRAKHQLHLTATLAPPADDADAGDDAGSTRTPDPGSLLAVLWPEVGPDFLRGAAAHATQPAPPGPEAPRGGPLRRVPAGWAPAWDEGAADGVPPVGTPVRAELPVFDWAGETARRIGSLVHAELQTLDIARSDERAIEARAPYFRRWLRQQGVPAERLADAVERVVEALLAVHGDPRARWILAAHPRDDVREHALSGHWEGQLLRVVFDRSFVDDQGTRWVIDYKTSHHQGGRREEFLDREVDRYRPQMQRYARFARQLGGEPVRVGLYFPLMRGWREWEPEAV